MYYGISPRRRQLAEEPEHLRGVVAEPEVEANCGGSQITRAGDPTGVGVALVMESSVEVGVARAGGVTVPGGMASSLQLARMRAIVARTGLARLNPNRTLRRKRIRPYPRSIGPLSSAAIKRTAFWTSP